MRRLWKFAGKLLILAAGLHLAVAAGLALVTSPSYEGRMANVRLLDSEPRAKQSFIASYLRAAFDDGRPLTCFVGSSFTWGYPMVEQASLTTAAGEGIRDSRTINASIIGAGLELTRNTLEIARESQVRFKRVVVEIPIVNELNCLELGCSWSAFCLPQRPEPFVRTTCYAGSYWEYFLTTPGGWNTGVPLTGGDGDEHADRPVQLGKLPESYFLGRERFAAVREAYGRSIVATLEAAGAIADEVVMFPSPIYVPGAESLGFDPTAIEEQVAFTVETGRRVDGVVVVELEPRHLADPQLFANVTHFNRRGSREFGRWLAEEIVSRDRDEAVAHTNAELRR